MERNTHQKKVIVDVLGQLKGTHPTADAVFERVREEIPSISRATVYRILNQSAEQGSVLRVRVPAGADRYDDCTRRHYHMLCKGCGKLLDVDIPVIEDLHGGIPESDKYVITGHDIIFSGFCAECGKKSK